MPPISPRRWIVPGDLNGFFGLVVDIGLAVTGLTALLDGLWLQLCLDPTSIRPKDAAALCNDWVDRVVGTRKAP